jgi:Zn-finger nucleic acid-binding protein
MARPCAKERDAELEERNIPADESDGGVTIDVCTSCRGVWLDWGEVGELKELQRLIPSMSGNTAWRYDLQRGRCPACEARPELARLDVGAFGVDRCPECLGLWFDGGELGPMLTDQGFESLLKTLRDNPV